LIVAIAMKRIGLEPRGIRLDSGDLSKLSIAAKKFIEEHSKKLNVDLSGIKLFASNDLNEASLLELNAKGHALDSYGIGTNLVTCQTQPALGMVYKLVELEHQQKIKFSEEIDKVPIPGKKTLYRLYNEKSEYPVADVLAKPDEEIAIGKPVYFRDFTDRAVKYVVKPVKVEVLLQLFWDGKEEGKLYGLHEARDHCEKQVKTINPKILDLTHPIDYKVFITQKLYEDTERVSEENNIWRDMNE